MEKLAFSSPYFDLFQISPHAYAAIQSENSTAGSNAGFIAFGEKAIIVDTFLNMDAAIDLKRACDTLIHPVSYIVVNTHYHSDHIIGNQLFHPEAMFIGTPATRTGILGDSQQSLENIQKILPAEISQMEQQASHESNMDKKRDLENDLLFIKNIQAHPVTLIPPQLLITTPIILQEGEIQITLHPIPPAHTHGDLIVDITSENVVFLGDLLFTQRHPWIGSGDPKGWIHAHELLLNKPWHHIVAGHGPLASIEDLHQQEAYLREILRLAENQLIEGKKPSDLQLNQLSAPFRAFTGPCFPWNLDFLDKYLSPEKKLSN